MINSTGTKRKIAILGGGMGAMSAAFSLTNEDGWQDKYDITLYQMGWRLGGKGASGRNAQAQQRIEEHGFHILFGFYENTFDTMRQCYRELGRSKDAPLAEFIAARAEDEQKYPDRYAMKRHSFFDMQQEFNGKWYNIPIHYPTDNRLPGDRALLPSPWDYIPIALRWMWQFFEASKQAKSSPLRQTRTTKTFWQRLKKVVPDVATKIEGDIESILPHQLNLHIAQETSLSLPEHMGEHLLGDFQPVYNLIADAVALHLRELWSKVKKDVNTNWDSYFNWVLQDFIGTTVIGFLRDNIPQNGFDSINDLNFWEWMVKHATVPEGTQLTITSAFVQGAYDSSFAYLNGDTTSPPTPEKPLVGTPVLEAGTMLRGGMRLLMGYKGAVSWMFQSGAGDVLFAPLYEVLRRRGVKFKFFHKVQKLQLPASGEKLIDGIVMERQVNLYGADYDPLVIIKGLPCWPSEPLYPQIQEGVELQARKVDLESNWTDWQPVETLTLQRGVDFDDVILGISLQALHTICAELKPVSTTWQNLLDNVKTTRTQAYQLWMDRTLEELGWTMDTPAADVGVQPINTWGDMSHEIPHENWPPDHYPKNIAYFCGPMADDPNQPLPPDPAYPPTQVEVVAQTTAHYLNNEARNVWPNAVDDKGFKWSWLVDPNNGEGQARLMSQYLRANIDPTERYVLSVPGTTQYRPKAGESDFANLYLCGDWIKTGVDAGCMEAACMSGMQASRALAGYPKDVPGETDFGFR